MGVELHVLRREERFGVVHVVVTHAREVVEVGVRLPIGAVPEFRDAVPV